MSSACSGAGLVEELRSDDAAALPQESASSASRTDVRPVAELRSDDTSDLPAESENVSHKRPTECFVGKELSAGSWILDTDGRGTDRYTRTCGSIVSSISRKRIEERIPDHEVLPRLQHALSDLSLCTNRQTVINNAARSGGAALKLLLGSLHTGSLNLRLDIIRGLPYNRDAEETEELSAALVSVIRRDPSAAIREEAVKSLMELGSAGAGEAVAALCRDRSVNVRVSVAAALPALGAVDAAARMLGDHSRRVRLAALKSLGAVGARARPHLALIAQSQTSAFPDVRMEATVALRLIENSIDDDRDFPTGWGLTPSQADLSESLQKFRSQRMT